MWNVPGGRLSSWSCEINQRGTPLLTLLITTRSRHTLVNANQYICVPKPSYYAVVLQHEPGDQDQAHRCHHCKRGTACEDNVRAPVGQNGKLNRYSMKLDGWGAGSAWGR